MNFKRIDVSAAQQLMVNNDAVVIDIRDAASFAAGHIKGAEHIHNDNVASFVDEAQLEKPLIVCCYHGNMSQGAAEYFSEQGFSDVYSLDGGYTAWQHAIAE